MKLCNHKGEKSIPAFPHMGKKNCHVSMNIIRML